MDGEQSRVLVDSVQRGSVNRPEIHELLTSYFEENSERIWLDALADHGFL
jgi:hypothetical protein